ncbi:hypothetical protein FIBSPDRAFT_852860, partial [Athelia psychrophila]
MPRVVGAVDNVAMKAVKCLLNKGPLARGKVSVRNKNNMRTTTRMGPGGPCSHSIRRSRT